MTAQSVQNLIDQANRRTAASRRQLFAKKSSDLQMLEHLAKSARVALDALHDDVRRGLVASPNCRAAMRELEGVVLIAEKRFV